MAKAKMEKLNPNSIHDVCLCNKGKLWICGKESNLPLEMQKQIVRSLGNKEDIERFKETIKEEKALLRG